MLVTDQIHQRISTTDPRYPTSLSAENVIICQADADQRQIRIRYKHEGVKLEMLFPAAENGPCNASTLLFPCNELVDGHVATTDPSTYNTTRLRNH